MSKPSSSGIGLKFLLVAAALVVIFAGLKAAQSLIAPFLLAVFFALILTPPLSYFKKKGLPDALAIIVLSGFVFLLGIGVVLIFSNSLTQFAAKLPAYKEKVTVGYTNFDTWINNAADKLSTIGESLSQLNLLETEETEGNELESPDSPHPNPPPQGEGTAILPLPEEEGTFFTPPTVEEWLADKQLTLTPETNESTPLPDAPPTREKLSLSNVIPVNTLISYVQTGINTLLNIATVSTLVLIMLVFMLMEAARLPIKIEEAFGGQDLSNDYLQKIIDDTWNYMKIKTIICFLTGVSTTVGLWFLGVEYALLWGLLMFFLNYIPSIGQVIASVPPVLLSLIDGGVSLAIWVTVWLVIVNTFWGIGIEPRYMGSGLGISSLIVLLSLIFWGWLLGPIGMFLSAPLTMVVKIVLQNDSKTRWIAVLLGNR